MNRSTDLEGLGPSLLRHEISFRVAYQETDGQRRVHHANYLNYFERGRVEMLRGAGISYRLLEDRGTLLVVTEIKLQYRAAAEFDDLLRLRTELVKVRPIRLWHRYEIERDGEAIVEGWTTIASVDRAGRPRRLPQAILRLRDALPLRSPRMPA